MINVPDNTLEAHSLFDDRSCCSEHQCHLVYRIKFCFSRSVATIHRSAATVLDVSLLLLEECSRRKTKLNWVSQKTRPSRKRVFNCTLASIAIVGIQRHSGLVQRYRLARPERDRGRNI